MTYSKVHEAWANSPATTTPISAAALDQIEEGVQTAQDTADTATTALTLKAPLASPSLTGTPTAPTAAVDTNTTQVATTAYAKKEADDAQAAAIAASQPANANLTTVGTLGASLQVLRTNSGATAVEWAAPASGGSVATDAIFDAAGDLPVGTGADTAARLAKGTSLQVLRVNSGATALEWASPAGGGDALVANPLSQFAATTSLQLKNTISDETGSGALVFANSPVFTTAVTLPVGLTGVIRADSGVVSVDSDVTDIVAAGTVLAAGKLELATLAEVTTGTDTARAVTPQGLKQETAILAAFDATLRDLVVDPSGTTTLDTSVAGQVGVVVVAENITTYTSGTTNYTAPTWATTLEVLLVGPGGSGGSGAKGASGSSIRGGGGGGAAGCIATQTFLRSELTFPISSAVGASGAGGAAATVNGPGNAGAAGSDTTFGGYLWASAGTPGAAGSLTVGGAGGTTGPYGTYPGMAGAKGGGDSAAPSLATSGQFTSTSVSAHQSPGAGGGGMGMTAVANTISDGSDGGPVLGIGSPTIHAGGLHGISNFGGNPGTDYSALIVGSGGGGGGRNTTGVTGAAGAGGAGGGGGGGGGAAIDTAAYNSGAGGAGGAGYIRIIARR